MKLFRHVSFGVCLGVEYQLWSLLNPTPTDKNENFPVHEQLYEFYAYDRCVVRFRKTYQ
jgi:hypothetical protein